MSPNGCVVLRQRRDPHGGSLRIERAPGQRLTRSRIEHKTHGFILARLQVSAHPCDQRLTGFGFQMTREDGDHGDLGRWQASQRKRPVLPRFFLSRFAGVGPISRPVLPRMGKASRRRVGFVKTAIHMGYVPSVPDGPRWPTDGPPMAHPMAHRWPNCQLPIANC